MATLTNCPECGAPFTGPKALDPAKHYTTHYPGFDDIPSDPSHYLARKRAVMLLRNDNRAEPPEGKPGPVAVFAPPQVDEEIPQEVT